MLCTTAIKTSKTIRTQTGAAESSGLDTNSCYVIIIAMFSCLLRHPAWKCSRSILKGKDKQGRRYI